MEQLIKFHQNKLDRDYCDKLVKQDDGRFLLKTCNENKIQIEKLMFDTWNKLNTKYEEFLQDNNKNVIVIKGEYYDRTNKEYYNNLDCAKYTERTLDNWMKYNSYEMDAINLFLKELPISYSLSLSPYQQHNRRRSNYVLKYKYTGGEELLITLTKLD